MGDSDIPSLRETGASILTLKDIDAICVPTCGYVRDDKVVMRHGLAKKIRNIDTSIPKRLATLIRDNGHVVQPIVSRKGRASLISLPVRPVIDRHTDEPGYNVSIDLSILTGSVIRLTKITNENRWKSVALPYIGEPKSDLRIAYMYIVNNLLDSRFIISNI